MAEKEQAKKQQQIELGGYEVRAVNDGGAEVRLTDSRDRSNFVSGNKTANRELRRGMKGRLIFVVEEVPEDAEITVTLPADQAGELPAGARQITEAKVAGK